MKSNKFIRLLFCAIVFTLLSVAFNVSAGALEYRDDLKLKVGLEFGPTSPAEITLSSKKGFNVISFNEETYESLQIFETSSATIKVKNVGGKAVIYSSAGKQLYTSDTQTMYLTGVNGIIKYNGAEYCEVIKIFCKDGLMRVINILAFENYIKGVLPREVYPSWPQEALKSAAIAARTFALYSLGGKHNKYGVDVCTTTCCQVFGGNGSNEYPTTTEAVEATKNMILAYNGKVAMAVYTSSAGYHTESSSGAWGGDQSLHPYLSGVPTLHETPEEYPRGTWTGTYTASEIFSYIDSKSSYAGKLKKAIASITLEHSDTGYAQRITVTDVLGNRISAKNSDNVRGMLSKFVRSASFSITPNYFEEPPSVSVLTADGVCSTSSVPYGASVLRADNTSPILLYPENDPVSYTITGTGWGHGVGMSQFGAMTLAKNGYSYTDILSLYYPGTYITTPSALAYGVSPSEQKLLELNDDESAPVESTDEQPSLDEIISDDSEPSVENTEDENISDSETETDEELIDGTEDESDLKDYPDDVFDENNLDEAEKGEDSSEPLDDETTTE